MQSLVEFMNRDRLKKNKFYKYFPKFKEELIELLDKLIKERGWNADLNDVDVSQIDDMSNLFSAYSDFDKFNGDISRWNVSNVTNMDRMFMCSRFNGDISDWDVSNVRDMKEMFAHTKFNRDISQWDVKSVTNMKEMFFYSGFKKDLSNWQINPICVQNNMFDHCPAPRPQWYRD